jgi:rhodanese-related sulfurtransferase
MSRRLSRLALVILLIMLGFAGVARAGEESGAGLQALQPVTADAFRKNMTGIDAELHLQEFLALRQQGPLVVLDVRDKESFARRHLKGSVNLPLTELTEKTLPAAAPDKNVPVVLVCDYSFMPVRMLAMTLQAYPALKANGYARVHRLNLWQSGKPGEAMVETAAQEQALAFEGSEVGPPAQ